MPRLADLQERSSNKDTRVRVESDELLILDARGEMTPAEMVEQKFLLLLESRSSTTSTQTTANN